MKGLKLAVIALLYAAGTQTANAPVKKASLWDKAKGYVDKGKTLYEENKGLIDKGKGYLDQGKALLPQVKEYAGQAAGYYNQYGKFIPTQTLKEAANTAASTATVWGGK